MKKFYITSWTLFLLGLFGSFFYTALAIVMLLGSLLLLIHGFINFFENLKTNLPFSLLPLPISFLTISLIFLIFDLPFFYYAFIIAFLLSLICLILFSIRKIELKLNQKLLYLYLFVISLLFFLRFFDIYSIKDSIFKHKTLIHHTKPHIKNEKCIKSFDSATAFADADNFSKCKEILFRCNNLEPNNSTILTAIGFCYSAQGDPKTALKYYYNAIKADSLELEAMKKALALTASFVIFKVSFGG